MDTSLRGPPLRASSRLSSSCRLCVALSLPHDAEEGRAWAKAGRSPEQKEGLRGTSRGRGRQHQPSTCLLPPTQVPPPLLRPLNPALRATSPTSAQPRTPQRPPPGVPPSLPGGAELHSFSPSSEPLCLSFLACTLGPEHHPMGPVGD